LPLRVLAAQGIRHAVIMLFEDHMVVNVDAGHLPKGILIGSRRERREPGLVQFDKQLPPGLAQVLHLPLVEFRQ
jgi:hypothetical protein